MSSTEQAIREQDLEAGWKRYVRIRWPLGIPPAASAQAFDERNAFGSGAAWMFELLMHLGERPHELPARLQSMKTQLHSFSWRTQSRLFY